MGATSMAWITKLMMKAAVAAQHMARNPSNEYRTTKKFDPHICAMFSTKQWTPATYSHLEISTGGC